MGYNIANSMKYLRINDMYSNKHIVTVFPEPFGRAYADINRTYATLKEFVSNDFSLLQQIDPIKLVQNSIEKFSAMGDFMEN